MLFFEINEKYGLAIKQILSFGEKDENFHESFDLMNLYYIHVSHENYKKYINISFEA